MSKIKPLATIESMSGKVCKHSDVYFRTNKVTGAVYTGKLCNPYTGEPNATAVALRARFKKVAAAVHARIDALDSTAKAAMMKKYHDQTTVGSFFGYCFKQWNNEYDNNGDLIVNGD